MSMLDGFEPIKRVSGIARVSISKDGVAFTSAVLEKMGRPQYVVPLIDRINKRFAIVASDHETEDTREFCKKGGRQTYGKRWSDRDLRMTLGSMMGWDTDTESHRVVGTYDYEENAFIFDLKRAEIYGKSAANEREE